MYFKDAVAQNNLLKDPSVTQEQINNEVNRLAQPIKSVYVLKKLDNEALNKVYIDSHKFYSLL